MRQVNSFYIVQLGMYNKYGSKTRRKTINAALIPLHKHLRVMPWQIMIFHNGRAKQGA